MMDEHVLQNTCLTLKGEGFFELSNAEFYSHNHGFNTTDLTSSPCLNQEKAIR